jgi:hypothetical protein
VQAENVGNVDIVFDDQYAFRMIHGASDASQILVSVKRAACGALAPETPETESRHFAIVQNFRAASYHI